MNSDGLLIQFYCDIFWFDRLVLGQLYFYLGNQLQLLQCVRVRPVLIKQWQRWDINSTRNHQTQQSKRSPGIVFQFSDAVLRIPKPSGHAGNIPSTSGYFSINSRKALFRFWRPVSLVHMRFVHLDPCSVNANSQPNFRCRFPPIKRTRNMGNILPALLDQMIYCLFKRPQDCRVRQSWRYFSFSMVKKDDRGIKLMENIVWSNAVSSTSGAAQIIRLPDVI